MPVLDQNNQAQVAAYNKFMREAPNAQMTQALEWSHVKDNWGNVQVYVERAGEIAAAVSILIRPLPLGYTLFYAPRGPICDIHDTELVQALVAEVDVLAKEKKAIDFKFDPATPYDEDLQKSFENLGFKVSNRGKNSMQLIQPHYEMILYTEDHDAETIMSKFAKRARNKIRYAQKNDVIVTYSSDEDYLKAFYEIHEVMAKRNHISIRSYDYMKKLMDTFGENARVYIAEHEGEKLAAAISILYGDQVYYLYSGSSNEKRKLNPNDLMNYEMIKWAIDAGAKKYNFGGVFELDKNDGLYLFKSGFCKKDGATEYIGEIDKVYNKPMFFMLDKVAPKIKELRLKISRK